MTRAELNRMKKDELLKLARSKKLKVTGSTRKAEIVDRLAQLEKAKMRLKPPAGKNASPRKRAKQGGAKGAGSGRAKASAKTKPSKVSRKTGGAAAAKGAGSSRAKTTAKRKTATPAASRIKETAPAAPKRAARERKLKGETIRQKAVASKYYLGAEEAVMPPVESMEVPGGYGIDRIVAMVRDPHWIFAYWEVTADRYRELEKRFGDSWSRCSMILRVTDADSDPRSYFDIALSAEARNWYINVQHDRSYRVAIGALGPDGTFVQVAVSNIVKTPRRGMSDVVDDRWMIPDEVFEKIFAASGGYDMQASSEELRALLERRLLEEISSGAVSSFGSGAMRAEEQERGFRLWVAAELILYGATEPDARVTVQGKEIQLRGDGTFSLRFALPDGKIDIPVTAVSVDRIEERTIETTVRKKSEEKKPVVR